MPIHQNLLMCSILATALAAVLIAAKPAVMSEQPENSPSSSPTPKQPELRGELLSHPDPFVKDFSPLGTAAKPQIPETCEAPPSAATGFLMNGQNNSRLPGRLPSGDWSVSWHLPAGRFSYPSTRVLWAKDRILIGGLNRWKLLDLAGRIVAEGQMANTLEIDPAQEYFNYVDYAGTIEIHSLSGGQKVSTLKSLALSNHMYAHRVTRLGKRWFVVALWVPHEEGEQVYRWAIEMSSLDWSPGTEVVGRLDTILKVETPTDSIMDVATGPDACWVALRNRLYRLGLDLMPQAAWKGEFNPAGMSIDDAGRMYLLSSKDFSMTLEVLSPEGERIWRYTFPEGVYANMWPPILGYRGAVYAITLRKVFAFDRAGQLKWQKDLANDIAGAGVTPDNALLLAAGSRVIAFGPDGKEKMLYDFGNEKTVAAPVLTSNGQLLVATEGTLYSLHATASPPGH